MPSAEMLAQADAGEGGVEGEAAAQHNQIVSQVLADSLTGGGANEAAIEAALGQLSSDSGAAGGLEAVASAGSDAVPAWHNAGGLTFAGANSVFSMEAAMLHQDAGPTAQV